ncbi:MAG TPA: FdtA/QdtA family cupin domain-containing protein [Chthoniobacterales bacterium]|jgi:hypothetical protein|nr:FdtA/QdtA family cupin domain-containing protein [Chthoniobacterales bacterium]
MNATDSRALSLCQRLKFPVAGDRRGNLTFVEGQRHIPFDIKRVYYLYDVPSGSARAGHAHKKLEQVVIAMAGSFDVTLDDGFSKTTFHLNRPHEGLYLPAMIWRDLNNFSSGAVCLAIASDAFDESDYFRDYNDFLRAVGVAAQK